MAVPFLRSDLNLSANYFRDFSGFLVMLGWAHIIILTFNWSAPMFGEELSGQACKGTTECTRLHLPAINVVFSNLKVLEGLNCNLIKKL